MGLDKDQVLYVKYSFFELLISDIGFYNKKSRSIKNSFELV